MKHRQIACGSLGFLKNPYQRANDAILLLTLNYRAIISTSISKVVYIRILLSHVDHD